VHHIVPAISLTLPICGICAWEQIPLASLQTDETLTLQILSSVSPLPLSPLLKTQETDLQGLPCNFIDVSSLISHPTYLLVLFCINVKQNRQLIVSATTRQEFTASQKTACGFIIQLEEWFGTTCPFTLGT